MKKPIRFFAAALAGLALLQAPIQAQAAPRVSVIRMTPNNACPSDSACPSKNTCGTVCLPDNVKELLTDFGISADDLDALCGDQSCTPNCGVYVYQLPNCQIQLPDTCDPTLNCPADCQPEDAQPDEQKQDEAKPVDEKTDEQKQDENKPADAKPDEQKQDENKPADAKPDEQKQDENKPADAKPDEQKQDENKPADAKPDEQKQDENKPANTKPDEQKQDEQTPTYHAYVLRIVELVNEARAEAGLQPVTLKADVTAVAQLRANEIITSFSHTRPNGSSCFTALSQAGVSYRGAGENIAYGQRSPEEVMNGWMNSAGHRANILNANFTTIGVGYVQKNGVNYWSQMFTY